MFGSISLYLNEGTVMKPGFTTNDTKNPKLRIEKLRTHQSILRDEIAKMEDQIMIMEHEIEMLK
jgi:hypothetical protein